MRGKTASWIFLAIVLAALVGAVVPSYHIDTGVVAGTTCDVGGTCLADQYLWAACVDGRYDTRCEVLQGGDSNRTLDLRINYTKSPSEEGSATWQVYADNATWGVARPTMFTVGIPAGCFAQQTLQFRYQDSSFMHAGACIDSGTIYSCWNGTTWQALNNPSIGFGKPAGAFCGLPNRGLMYESFLEWQDGRSS